MGLEISYSNGFVLDKNLEVKLNKAFEVISAEEDLSQYSINIRIVNDKEMMDLNRKFRKKDSSTNVLSFTRSIEFKMLSRSSSIIPSPLFD